MTTPSPQDLLRLAEEIENAEQLHYECEDCWYSCATLTCDDRRRSEVCDCGVDKLNVLLVRAAAALRLAAQAEECKRDAERWKFVYRHCAYYAMDGGYIVDVHRQGSSSAGHEMEDDIDAALAAEGKL